MLKRDDLPVKSSAWWVFSSPGKTRKGKPMGEPPVGFYMNPLLVGFSMNPLGCMDYIEMAYVNGNPATSQKNDLRSVQGNPPF